MYKTSYNGLCYIAREEAIVLVPYLDGKYYAQGVGHNDPLLTAESPAKTLEEVWAEFRQGLIPREKTVNNWLKVTAHQNEFDCFVSSYLNAGSKVKGVVDLFNKGDKLEAMALLVSFNRISKTGQFSPGLARRRVREMQIFLKADYGDLSTVKLWTTDPNVHPLDFTNIPFPPKEVTDV